MSGRESPEAPRGAREAAARALAKLAAARTRLVLERPFLGALVLHLPLVPSAACRTVATDGRGFHFNPAFVARLDFGETQFVLAHEALHCALLHFDRARHRVRRRWDRACDYAVNQLLVDDGMRAPAGVLRDPRLRGLAAEEIYPLLDDAYQERPLDEHWFGAAVGHPPPAAGVGGAHAAAPVAPSLLDAHRDDFDEVRARAPFVTPAPALEGTLAAQWRERLAGAGIEAAAAGRLGTVFRRVLDSLAQPRLPWRALLARFLMTLAREDYSFQRPSRREGDAILPGLASGETNLAVALDTSGSIGARDFDAFVGEIDALTGQIRARVTLLACDDALASGAPWRFEPWERLALPPGLAGGGGTRFTPVFEWLDAEAVRPDALLYFTDALGEFPERAPAYPVLWLVKGNAPIPWGERVQLNSP
ncbi:MAG: VWA-like domain-containing protein [Burkholderiales bacterium]|nr:VWA-like domain-containing protein [Burkholderiales bacterium]